MIGDAVGDPDADPGGDARADLGAGLGADLGTEPGTDGEADGGRRLTASAVPSGAASPTAARNRWRDAVAWDDDPVVAAAPVLPVLTDDLTADVCVIGLGGSGLGAIGAALDRGLSVVGLDAGRVAAGAAGRNGGILAPGPAIGAAEAARRFGLAAAREAYREAAAELEHLADLLGPQVIFRTGGLSLIEPVWDGDIRPGAELDREWAAAGEERRVLDEIGVPSEIYRGPLGSGVFRPGDAAMHPVRRALGLARRYAGRARLFEHSPVASIDEKEVRTTFGRVSAGLVLIAADGRMAALLAELADRVRPVRLQMLATRPIARRILPCPVHMRFGYDYAQQDSAGRLLVGGGRDFAAAQEETAETRTTAVVQQWVQQQAERLAGGPVTVTHRWAASAGYTPDGVPLVVRVRERVVACGGYNGLGNLMGPIAARAALVLGLDGVTPPPWLGGGAPKPQTTRRKDEQTGRPY